MQSKRANSVYWCSKQGAPRVKGQGKMGLFKGLKDTYKKSEAAVIVQNLLEMQAKNGLFDKDPASSATSLVDIVWTKSPHLFDGRFGQRPHKISIAAAAFSNAIQVLDIGSSNCHVFALCLGNILNEVGVNGKLYPFNNLDVDLLDSASSVYIAKASELANSALGREVDSILNCTNSDWDSWYTEYKRAASEQNIALKLDEQGMSLIDFMEDEPIKRAFRDGIDPTMLGKKFAEQFDISKMGIGP